MRTRKVFYRFTVIFLAALLLTCTLMLGGCRIKKPTVDPNHTHKFNGSKWEYDDNTHWHPAICEHTDLKASEAEHDGKYTCSVCGWKSDEPEPPPVYEVPVTGVKIKPTAINVVRGKTQTLTATVLPENATNKNVVWESLLPEVATVKKGVVTGVKAGLCTVVVRTEDGGFTATCNITVVLMESPLLKPISKI